METPPKALRQRSASANTAVTFDEASGKAKFYDWQTPKKDGGEGGRSSGRRHGRERAISHPDLRLSTEGEAAATPLSKVVMAATARRDATLGTAYARKRDLLVKLGRAFDVTFYSKAAPLGFKICLGRVSGDDQLDAAVAPASSKSTRKRILVDDRAGKGCENPNFKGSYLGRFPLVSADFWTSHHLSERSRT